MLKNKPSYQIFTQLIYYDIPNQEKQIPHWFSCAIVLNKSILKDYPFYSTTIGSFSNKFENGKESKNVIIYGDGDLNKMPNLSKLKSKINKNMKNSFLGIVQFMHSHEILFNKKIPLDKYCIKIMIRGKKENYKGDKEIEKIIDLAKEKNIPLKFRDYKINGKNEKTINNFIDSIESD